MWPPSFWFYPMMPWPLMPWLLTTRLPAMFFEALMAAHQPPVPPRPAFSAEIIPFPVRRAVAG
jgi:hypothetical protein